MGKILPKRKFFKSAIYTPNLDVGSHIDNVKYSLEHLIFSNTKEVESNLLKKRIKVVMITTILLMIIGSFISPKGQAEVAVFYPTACLGGWNNPRGAEGETEVTSDGTVDSFTALNSAVLLKETSADIYCGSFVGKIEKDTKPIKMVVTLSWITKGELSQDPLVSLDASTTDQLSDATTTATTSLLVASSTDVVASSTESASSLVASSTDIATLVVSTSTDSENGTTTESVSSLDKMIDVVKDVVNAIFGTHEDVQATTTIEVATTTDAGVSNTLEATTTVVEPSVPISSEGEVVPSPSAQPVESVIPEQTAPAVETAPVSFLENVVTKIATKFFTKVFAEELDAPSNEATSTQIESIATTTPISATTTINEIASSTDITVTSSDNASSTAINLTDTASSTTTSLNDFLEILYTFDGVTWKSLGTVNETSIQYRTFEIPVTASTSWEDMSQLQIKVQPVQRIDQKPVVYLDGIKVEVLYETPLTHEHPDFVRDTILRDEIVKGIRVLRIINNDTNKEEIWYMYPEEKPTSTSTEIVATSTEIIVSSTTTDLTLSKNDLPTGTSTLTEHAAVNESDATSTASTTENTEQREIKTSLVKNKWLKLESSEVAAKGVEALVKEIEKQEKKKEYMFPDFTKDTIKQISGNFLNAVIVQIEQAGTSTLWLFDTENDTEEKIDSEGKSTFSKTYPFGIKGDNVFWLSEDGGIVYMYNVSTKKIDHKEIPAFDISLGERGQVFFEGLDWKVIIGADQFLFYSEVTGEVFSDDNLSTGEAFRAKENLDAFLSQDKIEELNFVINKAEE